MVKDTFYLPNNKKIPFLTPTVKNFTLWNVSLFLLLILLLNVMFIFLAVYILHGGIDKRVSHEIEKVIAAIEVDDSTITIIDFKEINEPDFKTLDEESMFLQIYDLSGNILISSDNLKGFLPIPPELNFAENDFTFSDINVGEDRLRMGVRPLYNENGKVVAIIQVATFENELRIVRNRMIIFNLFLLPLIMLLVVVASIFLAKKSFKPITSIIETAEQISAKRLTSRIDNNAKPEDELGRLRDTLNGLFDRIESYVNQLSQFTDQASHQLMNPLTAIKTELEFILKKDRNAEEYKQSLEQLLNQADHMIKIVRTLLLLSKQDQDSSKSIFNLSRLIKSKVPETRDSHRINTEVEQDIYIKGDQEKFLMVLENLVDNAVKYSPDSDVVNVILQSNGDNVKLIVEDHGIGIDENDKEKIFERFYRSKKSEEMGIKGYGLGLSLVKTIVLEMGANIVIKDNHPSGTRFIITIKALNIT
jgi:signal transduction histidine kinase